MEDVSVCKNNIGEGHIRHVPDMDVHLSSAFFYHFIREWRSLTCWLFTDYQTSPESPDFFPSSGSPSQSPRPGDNTIIQPKNICNNFISNPSCDLLVRAFSQNWWEQNKIKDIGKTSLRLKVLWRVPKVMRARIIYNLIMSFKVKKQIKG